MKKNGITNRGFPGNDEKNFFGISTECLPVFWVQPRHTGSL